VLLYLHMCFLSSLISYLISSISERIFEPVDSLYCAPCSRHLDKMFSSQANFEFVHSGALELFPMFFLPPHFTVYTEVCCSPSLFLSNPVTESFSLSLPQTDSIARVLLFCANITRNILSSLLNLAIVCKAISCAETAPFLREPSLDPKG
jgi:hypothetical protein